MRLILLVHRYLAVAVGIVLTLWCLSGFVMMYHGYPSLTETERRACCARRRGRWSPYRGWWFWHHMAGLVSRRIRRRARKRRIPRVRANA